MYAHSIANATNWRRVRGVEEIDETPVFYVPNQQGYRVVLRSIVDDLEGQL